MADKFVKLALQLAARYAAWLREGLGGGASEQLQNSEPTAAQVVAARLSSVPSHALCTLV